VYGANCVWSVFGAYCAWGVYGAYCLRHVYYFKYHKGGAKIIKGKFNSADIFVNVCDPLFVQLMPAIIMQNLLR
jgi:hypothetical protein